MYLLNIDFFMNNIVACVCKSNKPHYDFVLVILPQLKGFWPFCFT